MSATPSGGADQAPRRLAARLVTFAAALRGHGVVVGTSEVVDAAAVAEVLGLDDRSRLREGLAAALLRRAGDRGVFDALFDVFFPAALGARLDPDGSPVADLPPPASDAERRARVAGLREELGAALAANDAAALDGVAARAVAQLGRGRDGDVSPFSAHQVLTALVPRTAIAAALRRLADAGTDLPGGSGDGSGGSGGAGAGASGSGGGTGTGAPGGILGGPMTLSQRLVRAELETRAAAFVRRVEGEARRRNAQARGEARIARQAVRRPLEQRDFALSGGLELLEMRRAIEPLSRILAMRIAARRRAGSRGAIDLRATLRASLSTGGVPLRPAYAHPHVSRPELVVLADLSSSVAGFSAFTILLVRALSAQFRRVRVFGFVNVCDELTDLLVHAEPGGDLAAEIAASARLTRFHPQSDYGSALSDFVDRYLLDAVGHRSAVLVLGDARTNHTDPREDALRDIVARARRVSWLNPEPAAGWGTGDSVAWRYARIVDMHECRNIAQLRRFVSRVLPV